MSATAFERMRREQRAKEEAEAVEKAKQEAFEKLNSLTVPELKELAKEKGIEGISSMKKEELIAALTTTETEAEKEDEKSGDE